MSLLVTGSIGIDTVSTPFGKSENCLGGSAVYFSMAASLFAPVRFVGAVGQDCPFDLNSVFAGRDVDLAGLAVRPNSKTFRWAGSYQGAMNDALTDAVELNVLAEHPPAVPDNFKDSKYIFLANTHPALQIQLLEQIDAPAFTVADTMNCWIENHLENLKTLWSKIDAIVLNDAEARMLSRKHNLIDAAHSIIDMGPDYVIIKKGEHGSLLTGRDENIFILPAFPTKAVKDPTGAGDSFAGALMGWLAGNGSVDFQSLKTGIAYGTVASSFTIEDFSIAGLFNATAEDIATRLTVLKSIVDF